MAEVADLFFLPFAEIYGEEQVDDQDYYYDNETLDLVVPVFSPRSHLRRASDPAFVASLDSSAFPLLDSADDMGSDYLGDGLGLAGGFAYEVRRPSAAPADGMGLLTDCEGEGEGLRVVGFDSDSESESDPESPLCWDSLRIDEERPADRAEELDWEEVDGGGLAYDRDVLSMLVGSIEEDDGSTTRRGESDEDDGEDLDTGRRSIDWEVLLALDPSGRDPAEVFDEVDEDLLNPSEYEILTGGQLAGYYDRSGRVGSPPAARSVVESLPAVVLTGEEHGLVCAVCKDEMSFQEHVTRLPCSHDYHRQCILPWLGIRNTCPVCRYELPTDDPEYENWRASRGAALETARDGYDLESFPAV